MARVIYQSHPIPARPPAPTKIHSARQADLPGWPALIAFSSLGGQVSQVKLEQIKGTRIYYPLHCFNYSNSFWMFSTLFLSSPADYIHCFPSFIIVDKLNIPNPIHLLCCVMFHTPNTTVYTVTTICMWSPSAEDTPRMGP